MDADDVAYGVKDDVQVQELVERGYDCFVDVVRWKWQALSMKLQHDFELSLGAEDVQVTSFFVVDVVPPAYLKHFHS